MDSDSLPSPHSGPFGGDIVLNTSSDNTYKERIATHAILLDIAVNHSVPTDGEVTEEAIKIVTELQGIHQRTLYMAEDNGKHSIVTEDCAVEIISSDLTDALNAKHKKPSDKPESLVEKGIILSMKSAAYKAKMHKLYQEIEDKVGDDLARAKLPAEEMANKLLKDLENEARGTNGMEETVRYFKQDKYGSHREVDKKEAIAKIISDIYRRNTTHSRWSRNAGIDLLTDSQDDHETTRPFSIFQEDKGQPQTEKKKAKKRRSHRNKGRTLGWNIFQAEFRQQASASTNSIAQFSSTASAAWKAMSEDERMPYHQRAEEQNKRMKETSETTNQDGNALEDGNDNFNIDSSQGLVALAESSETVPSKDNGLVQEASETIISQDRPALEDHTDASAPSARSPGHVQASGRVFTTQTIASDEVQSLTFAAGREEDGTNNGGMSNRPIKQEELSDDETNIMPVSQGFVFFRVRIASIKSCPVRVSRQQNLKYIHLRRVIEDELDAEIPFPSFQFALGAGSSDRLTPKQEEKWGITDDPDLGGDGSRGNPYRLYIEETVVNINT